MRDAIALIPGAGGQGWLWHLVEADLRARGFDAFAIDLPAADEACGLPAYADTVVAAIGDRTDVTLVAQSMGGFTAAPRLAARAHPRRRVRQRDDPAARRDRGRVVGSTWVRTRRW